MKKSPGAKCRRRGPGRTLTVTLAAALLLAGSWKVSGKQGPGQTVDLWIGQMIMVGFRGTELGQEAEILSQIRDLHLGGVILFDYDVPSRSDVRNIRTPEQVRKLVSRLQSAAEIPLFVAIDQEGGRIARLKPARGFPRTLSQAELGRRDSEQATRGNARQIGSTLGELGVNVNFAPVLDLSISPENPVIAKLERSYGADPELVVRHALWTIEEFHKAGVLSAVKHFPGHGSSLDDSHKGLPDVTGLWDESELEPFRLLIRQGLPNMVMTAHIFNRDWDREFPATLSRRVLQGILREDLGFDGVVVSDDMQMSAIVDNFRFEKSIQLAVSAGVDILLVGNNQNYDPVAARKVFRVIRDMIDRGDIPEDRIRRSFERIEKLKSKLKGGRIPAIKGSPAELMFKK